MFKKALLSGVIAIGMTNPSFAASAREMSPSELRAFAEADNTVNMQDTLQTVSKSFHAEVVEARAFDACGVYYRLVLKQTDGQLDSITIDARTGKYVPSKSSVALQVSEAASMQTAQMSFDVSSQNRSNGH